MNTESKQELYTSPEVKVIEVKARQVVCTSPDYGSYTNGEQEGY